MKDPAFSIAEKIEVLLAEYNTLREEILERNMVLNQFLAAAVTGGIAIFTILSIGNETTIWIGAALFVLVPPVILLIFKILEFDTLAAAKRIRELEAVINDVAGEPLLVWETNNGLYRVKYGRRFRTTASAGSLFVVSGLIALVCAANESNLAHWLNHIYQSIASYLRL